MSRRFDCSDPSARAAGIDAAVTALGQGRLVVLPTDTVYGVGADAFDPRAVAGLLAAKGRGRHKPSPVLVGSKEALDDLVADLPGIAEDLIGAFWPGGLTLVLRHRPSLDWDLGETGGTVAVRMPDHPLALDLLAAAGPMAVSSANLTDRPSPEDCEAAFGMLGDSVAVYLDGGRTAGPVSSSIVDLTGDSPVLVREGVLSAAELAAVAPGLTVR
ncbi:L-threonylcarbamoyladenylate synthase [Streptomyces tanashiensis]|uniref:L-threonylcarbamoyladenylate synthase n=1 Tax=Streptomyces tanashiensis TaxID=67367 RepID=A0ABY6RA27_9ACTN|nr:L-threonylcarbamoyladenylate synthase [Streptomyces tanashiensis]UZX25854.1 threonylcarbamoyl-AMP synthase [Streptomyces tanashiensis]